VNTIERMLQDSNDVGQFATNYFKYVAELFNSMDFASFDLFAKEMEQSRQDRNTVYIVGNGGSAATASHMANDFGTDIRKRTQTAMPFRVLSLTDNTAVMSAVANDDGYDQVFVNQLKVLYHPGDKLIAISASGNSPNLVKAAQWVKGQGGTVMSFVGFDGGKLKSVSDIAIHVKSSKGDYGPVEDIHLMLDHMLSYWAQYKIVESQKEEKVT